MIQLPDHPVVASMLRTGYPPWMDDYPPDDDGDTEELESFAFVEPYAIYDPD